jgi:hypothetical protein
MADIPAPLTYGTVTGHFISILADTADVGNYPDILGITGSVTITPTIKSFHISGYLVAYETITATIVGGELRAPDGITPLRILATDSPGLSPSPFQYVARFALNNVTVQPPPVTFSLPGGSTVDLSSLISSADPVTPVQTVMVADALYATIRDNIMSMLIAGTNISLVENGDNTITISSTGTGGSGGGASIFIEDPYDPGTYTFTSNAAEDPADPGTYIIGA